MSNVTVVVGAQFGSEGKGAVVAHLAKKLTQWDTVIRVAGPNAGHTVLDENGSPWKLRAVPVAAVTNAKCQLHVAAGSEIDLDVLNAEVSALDEAGFNVTQRLTVHPSATILTDRHKSTEGERGLIARVGSTGKGIGAARADRIMREAEIAGSIFGSKMLSEAGPFETDGDIIIEGTQGYGLGLHTTFYPQTTSSDCRAIDFLAMAGISPWSEDVDRMEVIAVARVYPIRVAGNSGPLKGETSWAELGLPEERTTVTNNVRRVGKWDRALVQEALLANGGGFWNPNVTVALTMLDHLYPDVAGRLDLGDEAEAYVHRLELELEANISLVGTGPSTMVTR